MTVGEFIKLANISNDRISLFSKDIEELQYYNTFYEGMEWALLESSLADLPFKRLHGVLAESIFDSDKLYIEVDVPGLTKDNITQTEWGKHIPTEEQIHDDLAKHWQETVNG